MLFSFLKFLPDDRSMVSRVLLCSDDKFSITLPDPNQVTHFDTLVQVTGMSLVAWFGISIKYSIPETVLYWRDGLLTSLRTGLCWQGWKHR